MKRTAGLATAICLSIGATAPVMAQSQKETDCRYQAAVVSAVQEARRDRVRERKVVEHVTARATWPEKYNAVIPLVTPWVYETRMRDVRREDLGALWQASCLQN